MRSAQKLLDHVNFSPLHKAALEGGGPKVGSSTGGAGASRGIRRVLYDGSKLFWRANETLELCIFEDTGANSVTVAAFQQQKQQQPHHQILSISPVIVDSGRLKQALGIENAAPSLMVDGNRPISTPGDGLPPSAADHAVKFLLARLQAKKDAQGVVSLYLHRLHNGEADPNLLLQNQHTLHALANLPSDLNVRRRHTIDDVKEAEKGVKVAAAELRQARQQAESFSQLARISLEAFSRRNEKEEEPKRRASDWTRLYDRVTLQNAVERSKEAIQAFEHRPPLHFETQNQL